MSYFKGLYMIHKLYLKGDYCTDRLSWGDAKSILDNNGCIVTVTNSYEYRIAFKYSGKYLIKYIGSGARDSLLVDRAIQGIDYLGLGASNLLTQGPDFGLDTYFTAGEGFRYSKVNVHPNAFKVGYVNNTSELPMKSIVSLNVLKLRTKDNND